MSNFIFFSSFTLEWPNNEFDQNQLYILYIKLKKVFQKKGPYNSRVRVDKSSAA